MNFLILSAFAIICAAAVESRYPYDDAYVPGDIVPQGINAGLGYGRDRYIGKHRGNGIYGGGYGGIYNRRNSRYGRNRDVLHRDYNRRRYGEYDTHLPPRGIGGYNRQGYDRPGYDYRRNRPQVHGPPKYYDDDYINDGGYTGGIGFRY